MKTVQLTIPNMKSPHCQMTVTGVVNNLGAQIKSIAPTQAEIELPESLTKETVVAAIEQAGYKVN